MGSKFTLFCRFVLGVSLFVIGFTGGYFQYNARFLCFWRAQSASISRKIPQHRHTGRQVLNDRFRRFPPLPFWPLFIAPSLTPFFSVVLFMCLLAVVHVCHLLYARCNLLHLHLHLHTNNRMYQYPHGPGRHPNRKRLLGALLPRARHPAGRADQR